MEPQLQSSFIPKKPIASPAPTVKPKGGGGPMSLTYVLTLVIFVVTLVVSGGVFGYQQLLGNAIERKAAELEEARAVFEPALIQELRRLDMRMKTAESLVEDHVAASLFLEFLETATLTSVQYEALDYTVLDGGAVTILMTGKAKSFNALALQSDLFGRNELINNPLFSGIDVGVEGNVVFTLEATVDPTLVSYVERRVPTFSSTGIDVVEDDTATTTDDASDDVLDDESVL